ncbi:MAG: Gfo/Idh/MocA family oxidoreductase [Verrucomicrobia bacterium]|nr:Gfo/Idh/MocA family oxidoreductase [Verrucomicrobiota bacterium]
MKLGPEQSVPRVARENQTRIDQPPALNLTRRGFLGGALAVAGFNLVSRHVVGGTGQSPPSERLNLGFIGAGGRGADNLESLKHHNIAAFCDVDWERAQPTFERYPQVPRYRDYRLMLERERSLDAVVVSTPDHTHSVATLAAIEAGKHVYCEKPLTRTVKEARRVAQAARAAKVATQMGNQGMAFEGNRLIEEWLSDGAIGTVREVHVWSDRPTQRGRRPLWWPQGLDRPSDTPAVPPTLDWDLWLGPAPWRPYHPAYLPFRWRGWWDFGSGGLGDMGIHNLAPVFAALRLGPPTSVVASSTPVYAETVPLAAMVHYQFPARGDQPGIELHWYDGGLLPPRPEELEADRPLDPEDGILFVGDRGKMLVEGWGGERPRLIPESRNRQYVRAPKTLPRSVGHYEEWIQACKTGSATRSSFDFAGPLTEAVLLGSVAIRIGNEKLLWDSRNLRIPNHPEAEPYLDYAYREGWS